jgi:hypothetical protein
MMINFNLRVSGDTWNNHDEFIEFLNTVNPAETLVLNLDNEGPCLASMGIIDLIDSWLKKHSKSTTSVYISNWTNSVQLVPYQTINRAIKSHFWIYSQHYWTPDPILSMNSQYMFGLFLGRNTVSRNVILYDVIQQWSDKFLISKMSTEDFHRWPTYHPGVVELENIDSWMTVDQQKYVIPWINNLNILSLDNKSVQDQYCVMELSAAECAQSLLRYYDQFCIELVCETYTIGDTFFPTEKTVRPIMAGKPILVYGPKNYLANLRNLGFQTWSSCWDESYDQYEGPERWAAIKQVINNLIIDSSKLKQAIDISLYNRQILSKMINDFTKF